MSLFQKDLHPLDSRHPSNRAQSKALDQARAAQTRSGKRKLDGGGLFKRSSAQQIREQLAEIENAPTLDLATQKRLQRKLPEVARKEAEKEFWARQGLLGHIGIFGLINQLRAFFIGDKSAGTKTWVSYAKVPIALLFYLAIVNFGISTSSKSLSTKLMQEDGFSSPVKMAIKPQTEP